MKKWKKSGEVVVTNVGRSSRDDSADQVYLPAGLRSVLDQTSHVELDITIKRPVGKADRNLAKKGAMEGT